MKSCPSVERWRDFLDDGLASSDEAELTAHLEDCRACVHTLETLTSPNGDSALKLDSTCDFAAAADSSGVELQRLKSFLPATTPAPVAAVVGTGMPHVPGYEIERELGRGGMGVVYLARQRQLNRRVALKMVLAGEYATQEQLIRFLAEAQTCAGLTHPNIVQIFEVGQHAGIPFFAMEYVAGGTLADRARTKSFTPDEAAALVELLARAMDNAHRQGIVHRDLKPANVLLQMTKRELDGDKTPGSWDRGQEPTDAVQSVGRDSSADARHPSLFPKITDFGLAKRFDRDAGLTQAGAILGTPDYMAPEQVDPGTAPIGPGVDIYALGAILYYLMTGRTPCAGATSLQTLANVRHAEPVAPSQLNRAVPRDLSIICLHCLEKDPRRRYASAEALAEDLRRFRNGEPIAARPTPELERLWKWAKRRPAIATLSALLVVVVFASLALVSWKWYEADEARSRETVRANNEASALQNEAAARKEAQLLSASYALDQGILECRAGRIQDGLLSMVRALKLLPPDQGEMEFAIRANIGAWRERLCLAQRGQGHETAVVSVAASPDGKTALIGNWGNLLGHRTPAQAKLWRLDRWDRPPLWTVEHPSAVWSVAFHPNGERVAVGGFDGTTCVREARTGVLCYPPLPHSGRVFCVAFSPDGKTLAVGGHASDPAKPITGGGELRLFDAATGASLGGPHSFSFRVASLAWTPDSQAIALGGFDPEKAASGLAGIACFFDVAGRTLTEPRLLHGDAVTSVAVHPDGKLLATGCRDGLVRFWRLPACTLLPKPLLHANPVNNVCFSKNGAMLATASGHHEPLVRAGTGEIHVWDVATRALVTTPHFDPLNGHSQKMHSVAFADDDRKLVAASEHGRAWLWHLPPPLAPLHTFSLKDAAHIDVSPDGRTLLLTVMPPRMLGFGKQPCEIHVIDVEKGSTLGVLPFPVCVHVRFRSDSKRFITFPRDPNLGQEACLWDAVDCKRLPLPSLFNHSLHEACFADDGEAILTIAKSGMLQIWDVADLGPRGEPRPCLVENEWIVAVNNVCSRLLTSGPNGTRLVSLPDCRLIAHLCEEGAGFGCFNGHDETVVTVVRGANPEVKRWSAADGNPIDAAVSDKERFVRSSNRRLLIDLKSGCTNRDWSDPPDWRSSIQPPLAGETSVHRTGQWIVATDGGVGKHLQLWSSAGRAIGPPLPHPFLYAVEFHPNGRLLITSSNDRTTKIWSLPVPAEGTAESLRSAFRGQAQVQTQR